MQKQKFASFLKRPCGVAFLAIGGLFGLSTVAWAQITPIYTSTYQDAVTGDNRFLGSDNKYHYDVDAGADIYQFEVYERPTSQTFTLVDGRFATTGDYFGNLDIVQAQSGFDSQFFYARIDMFSTTEFNSSGGIAEKGLSYQYGIRFSVDPNGAGGFLLVVDDPAHKNNPTQWNGDKAFGYRDLNGDVGGTGLSVTKSDRQAEVNGNGYESAFISDGKINGSGPVVLFTRLSPTDPTVVEIAINYIALGLTATNMASLGYLDFEANKGLQDNANYFWNDEYTGPEAGSPNRGAGGLSEFGTSGTGNIYELDTLRGIGVVPETDALIPLAALFACAVGVEVRRRRRATA